MKKIIFILSILLATGISFAQESGSKFTGEDYLNLSRSGRVEVIKNFKANAKKSGIIMKKEPVKYCRLMDEFYVVHPDFLKESAAVVIKTLAIMEYDWQEKGKDKDKLAREWLGEDVYQANKRRREDGG